MLVSIVDLSFDVQISIVKMFINLLFRRLDSNIELLKGSLHRAQLHVTRLHWLHEDLFIQAGRQPHNLMVANRATIMSEIKKVVSFLSFVCIHVCRIPSVIFCCPNNIKKLIQQMNWEFID